MRNNLINVITTAMYEHWGKTDMPELIADAILQTDILAARTKTIGKVYGMLTIMERVERKGYYFKCLCSCGQTKEVAYSNLASGVSISCGCVKPRQWKENNLK